MKTKGKKLKEMNHHKWCTRSRTRRAVARTKRRDVEIFKKVMSLSGYSVIEVESDNIKAEMEALKNIDGVVAVEMDRMMNSIFYGVSTEITSSWRKCSRSYYEGHPRGNQDRCQSALRRRRGGLI